MQSEAVHVHYSWSCTLCTVPQGAAAIRDGIARIRSRNWTSSRRRKSRPAPAQEG